MTTKTVKNSQNEAIHSFLAQMKQFCQVLAQIEQMYKFRLKCQAYKSLICYIYAAKLFTLYKVIIASKQIIYLYIHIYINISVVLEL